MYVSFTECKWELQVFFREAFLRIPSCMRFFISNQKGGITSGNFGHVSNRFCFLGRSIVKVFWHRKKTLPMEWLSESRCSKGVNVRPKKTQLAPNWLLKIMPLMQYRKADVKARIPSPNGRRSWNSAKWLATFCYTTYKYRWLIFDMLKP